MTVWLAPLRIAKSETVTGSDTRSVALIRRHAADTVTARDSATVTINGYESQGSSQADTSTASELGRVWLGALVIRASETVTVSEVWPDLRLSSASVETLAVSDAATVWVCQRTLTMPSTPKPRRCLFGLRANTLQFSESPSGAGLTKRLDGARWMAVVELPPMKRANAAAWQAFLTRCNGRAEQFLAGDPAAETARGNVAGTPVVTDSGQSGSRLTTSGWTGSGTVLYAGDYFSFVAPSGRRELHKITADAVASTGPTFGNGGFGLLGFGYSELTLDFVPPLRESPAAGTVIEVSAPKCLMRLVDDEQAAWDVDAAAIYGLQFQCEEALP